MASTTPVTAVKVSETPIAKKDYWEQLRPLPPQLPEQQDPMRGIKVGLKFESTDYKYRLEALIGNGGYGKVFEATAKSKTNTKEEIKRVAIKIEARTTPSTTIEAKVLQAARDHSSHRFPIILDKGTINGNGNVKGCSFIAMDRKGRDLYHLRKERQGGKYTLGTCLCAGIATLEAIKELHELGYISRDVKPANFVTGPRKSDDYRNVFMIDFGLCKKYKDKQNNILPSRGEVGWRGTNRYASLQAHCRQDLSRRDDVESWYYMLVEMTKGALPWAGMQDREEIHEEKEKARTNPLDFLKDCPPEYEQIMRKIDALSFGDAPDYQAFIDILESIIRDQKIDRNQPMDWETDNNQQADTDSEAAYSSSIESSVATAREYIHSPTHNHPIIDYPFFLCKPHFL